MLQFDQESQPVRRSAHGLSGPPGGAGRVLDALAREIEDMQRQQSETMAQIVGRLRAAEDRRPTGMRAPHVFTNVDTTDDEPWDTDSAEALMRSYETEHSAPKARAFTREPASKSAQDWIGERFNDVTQRITQALSDLKPGSTAAVLEERLDAFQRTISSALEDVVRRSDLDGLRLIELHVADLSDKLDELERHVSRISGIESDVRSVLEQVSDERIAKLLDYDSRFAADLETVARRAAEEVHARLGQNPAHADADSRRHEELRALIEASIQDRREAEAQAVSLVTGLSGRVSQQSDRYDEIKGLLEQAIQEQRQNEQAAFGMLDTLQQALVTVLDRMDALETQYQAQHHPRAAVAAPIVAAPPVEAEPPPVPPAFVTLYDDDDAPSAEPPAIPGEPSYAFRDTRFDGVGAHDEAEAPVEVPAAFSEPDVAAGPDVAVAAESEPESESALDRIRRDFVAEARRAKLKAAANRAEALGEKTTAEPQKPAGPVAQARATLAQSSRLPLGGGSGRLFGMSTKLLAGVLALIIAINGGLLLLARSSAPPAELARPTTSLPHAPALERRSDVTQDDDHAGNGQTLTLYGFQDDVLNPPALAPSDGTTEPDVPRGMTIARPAGSLPEEAVADVYEQQVLASLSGKLGMLAAGQSPDALLPEKGGRIDAAYPVPELAPGSEGSERASGLDLPPATVGPMSLRLAAANGDASAEFEVAARLAEGKGTSQNYAEALRWYQRSAAKGFAQAQYRLGTLYERGLGAAKDLKRAKVWYSRAAEGGNVKAMHNLAVLLAGGEDGAPDYAAAAPWFQKAAEHGLGDSQYNLGVLLENGLAGTTDRVSAFMWYTLAAKNGDDDAV